MTDLVAPASAQPPAPKGFVRGSRLADQAYEWLKEQILTQQMLPGQRLSVPAIADELGLSRSPVREAVQRLVQEGLGSERPHQGAVVASADLPSLVRLYQVRAVLEGLSAELAARSGDDELEGDLVALLSVHRAAYEESRRPDVISADMAFHRRILRAAGNVELSRVVEPILERMYLAMLAGEEHWPSRALEEHQAVIDAIRDRDPGRAQRSMAKHVNRVRASLLAKVGDETAESR